MRSTYMLKVPFILTFSHDNATRQEIVTHLTFHTAIDEGDPKPLTGYQDVDALLALLDLDDDENQREVLSRMDLDYGLRSAYADAEERAMSFLAAATRPEHAGTYPIHFPTREERRDASFRQAEAWVRDNPMPAPANQDPAA